MNCKPGTTVLYTLSSLDEAKLVRKGGFSKAGAEYPGIILRSHPYSDGSRQATTVDIAVLLPEAVPYTATDVYPGAGGHHSWRPVSQDCD